MLRFFLRRMLGALPTLAVIICVSFFLIRMAPGGPFDRERTVPPEVAANLNAAFHLDEPMWKQFFRYVGDLLQGNMGPSFQYRDYNVTELVLQGFPISLQLGLSAIILALLIGLPAGAIAALRQNSATDYTIMTAAMTGITIPNFVMAPLLSLIFGVYLNWLPVAGWGDWRQMILPVLALALPQVAYIARLTRGSMIEVLGSNYIRTARAKGLREIIVVRRHALKAAMLPVISYLGPATAAIVTGSVVIEQIFNLPGIGRYFIQGALNRDYTLVMGVVVFYGAIIIFLNLIVDLLYGLLDPKVRSDG